MTVHEFGDPKKPVLLLFPGTMCYWKSNFGAVIDRLTEKFFVAAVAYTGFDESDREDYQSVEDELGRIEAYVQAHYNGSVRAAYGCSLGGTFVAQLAARHRIHMRYGILGSSDLDQAGPVKAAILTQMMVGLTYHFVHTGSYRTKLMQKRFRQKMQEPDPYNRAFVALLGRDRYNMSFITKQSIKNQFRSDLTTPLPVGIDNGETEIHVFYAKKMGEKYLARYRKHFKSPVIHEQELRHEELLGLYPADWCTLVEKICL